MSHDQTVHPYWMVCVWWLVWVSEDKRHFCITMFGCHCGLGFNTRLW